ncbi:MAG: hypothetical protein GTN76_16095 [Candidatus Aenigmarchaeota archaeon]|nr:hypothetical protein [Candidatus Aenigmarchaeota archaeon]
MHFINSDSLRGAGKNTRVVTYNSSFGDLKIGHLADIHYCMESLVKPNEYKGLVIGIGYPDPPEFFPKSIDKERLNKEDEPIFRNIKKRLRKPEDFKTYFERLYLLKMALRGEIPYDKKKRGTLKKLGIEAIPIESVFVIPKYSHTVFPWLYDMVYRSDYQGYMEPEKDDIQTQFIYIREDRQRDRLKEKDAQRRNIHVTASHDEMVPELIKRYRSQLLLTKREENSVLKKLRDKEFELYISAFDFLDDTQMQQIDETLNEAAKHDRESVFVVPYKDMPKDTEENREFWRQIRATGNLTHSRLSPFSRYLDVKRHIDGLFRVTPVNRKNAHVTLMEMREDGLVDEPQKSFSYMPQNIAGMHGYQHIINNLKLSVDLKNPRNNGKCTLNILC